jgi:hypothetical protein
VSARRIFHGDVAHVLIWMLLLMYIIISELNSKRQQLTHVSLISVFALVWNSDIITVNADIPVTEASGIPVKKTHKIYTMPPNIISYNYKDVLTGRVHVFDLANLC